MTDKIEALGEALHGLSARLLLSGALEDAANHAAYEKVVAAFSELDAPRNTDEWVKRADYNRLYQEFDAKCRDLNKQSTELTQARAEIALLREALEGTLDGLRRASRQLTDDHKIVLWGKPWGGLLIDNAEAALKDTQ